MPRYNFTYLLVDEVCHLKKEVFIQAKKNHTSHDGWSALTGIEGIIQCILLLIYEEDPYRRGIFCKIADLDMVNRPYQSDSIIYRVWQLGKSKKKRRYLGTAFVDQKLVARAIFTFEIV
jgi:hypothetical protein